MRIVIGVMGGGHADTATQATALELGMLIARRGWVLLNGGRDAGVMAASAKGAKQEGGLTIGILPDDRADAASGDIDIPIVTGMGDARNVINVLSSRVVIAMTGGAGTISEVAHALKLGRPVVALGLELDGMFAEHRSSGRLADAGSPSHAIELAAAFLEEESRS